MVSNSFKAFLFQEMEDHHMSCVGKSWHLLQCVADNNLNSAERNLLDFLDAID